MFCFLQLQLGARSPKYSVSQFSHRFSEGKTFHVSPPPFPSTKGCLSVTHQIKQAINAKPLILL